MQDNEVPNALVIGLYTLSRLHFGKNAGFDWRILYALLGFGVCGLIITGNLLWLQGVKTVVGTQIGLAVIAGVLFSSGRKVYRKPKQLVAHVIEEDNELLSIKVKLT